MDNQAIIDALRRQNQLKSEAANSQARADAFGTAFPRPQYTTQTSGYGGSIGGSSFQVPPQVNINYGDIIGKGLSNFFGARAQRDSNRAEAEAESINQEFMMSTLESDPEAQKLYGLAQAGMPGAAKALAEHIEPKKEALAGFMQANSQGTMDPDLAAEVAPQYGIDPDLARKAATYARQQKEAQAARKMSDAKELIDYRTGKSAFLKGIPSASSGRSRAGKEITLANGGVAEVDGDVPYGLTPGQKQNQAKNLTALDDVIMKGEAQIAKFPDVWEAASKPGGIGKGQQLSQFLSESNSPLISAIGMATRSKDAALLHDYANSEVLSRMGQLGGNDSNEELRRMQASVPNALQNPETMKALLKRFDAWQKKTMEIVKRKRQDMQTGRYYAPDYKPLDPRNFKAPELEESYNPQQSGSPAVSPDSAPKKRKSFDEIMNEVNQ